MHLQTLKSDNDEGDIFYKAYSNRTLIFLDFSWQKSFLTMGGITIGAKIIREKVKDTWVTYNNDRKYLMVSKKMEKKISKEKGKLILLLSGCKNT